MYLRRRAMSAMQTFYDHSSLIFIQNQTHRYIEKLRDTRNIILLE